jgi:uncharacterized protein
MRRSEREITDRAAIDGIIRQAQVCRLGIVDGDRAYVVPLCFGYDGRCLYFHCATAGRKLDLIRTNPRVSFEFDLVDGIVTADRSCNWGIRYRSVLGTGTAEIVTDPSDTREALAALMAQYGSAAREFPDSAVERTLAIRVVIESVTGKRAEG